AGLYIDAQRDVASRQSAKMILDMNEISADQREQISRLGMWIVPDRKVPAAGQFATFDQIAVRQQHRRFGFAGFDTRSVDRHHVGTVREIRDAAETFSFTLRAKSATRLV